VPLNTVEGSLLPTANVVRTVGWQMVADRSDWAVEGRPMTEEEWVQATDVVLRNVMCALDPRRQRLLAVAVCRAMGDCVDYPIVRDALNKVDAYADTGSTKAALRRARQAVQALRESLARGSPVGPSNSLALFVVQIAASENAVFGTLEEACRALAVAEGISEKTTRRRLYAPYRDIVGGLSRPVEFSPEWRTTTAVQLAKGMYESRDFSAMPILADAL
jgi:hypothetical protein